MPEPEGVCWGCDKHLIGNYLKQVSQNHGGIFKKQCGDQYGFGDDIDSNLHIMKNMDQKMLHNPDPTNKKVY